MLVEENAPHVTLWLLALNPPFVSVSCDTLSILRSSCRVHVSIKYGDDMLCNHIVSALLNVFPFDVIVLLVKFIHNEIVFVFAIVIPEESRRSQYTVNNDHHAKVPVNPLKSNLFTNVVASIVLVPDPEFPSKYTSFDTVGTDAPDDPPEVVDQLVVLLQFPVPPVTQYLLDIVRSDHPELFDTNVLFAPAVNVAPPHTYASFTER